MIIIIAIVTETCVEAEPARVALTSIIKKHASTHEEPVNYDYSNYFSYFGQYSYVSFE